MDNLSLELVQEILGHLKPSFDVPPTPAERATLVSCCLVHPTWRETVQPWLYADIGPDLSIRQRKLLINTLTTCQHYGLWVEGLELNDPSGPFDPSDEGNVAELEGLFDSLLLLCSSSQYISIETSFDALHVPWESIFSSSNLKNLELECKLTLFQGRQFPSSPPSSPAFLSMFTLRVDLRNSDPEYRVLEMLLQAPNLWSALVKVDDRHSGPTFQERVVHRLQDHPRLGYLDISLIPLHPEDCALSLPSFTTLNSLCIHWEDLESLPFLPSTLNSLCIKEDYLEGDSDMDRSELEGVAATLVSALERVGFPKLRTLLLEFPPERQGRSEGSGVAFVPRVAHEVGLPLPLALLPSLLPPLHRLAARNPRSRKLRALTTSGAGVALVELVKKGRVGLVGEYGTEPKGLVSERVGR